MKDTGAAELIPDTNCLSVTSHGMEYLSNAFPLGTGPLFDFEAHAHADGGVGLDCSVSLTSTSFRNSTSKGSPRTPSGHFASLTQRMLGCSMSHSTNPLSGTSGMNLNWRGSSLLVNSSFSTCVTNTDLPTISEPNFPDNASSYMYFKDDSPRNILYNATTVENNRIYVDSCTFIHYAHARSGGAISLNDVGADVWIKKSTFQNCYSVEGCGGAMYFSNNDADLYNTGSIEIFGCTLSENTCVLSGGHVFLEYYESVVVAECVFEDFWIHPHLANDLLTDSFHISTNYFVRFHNSTFARNKGYRVGGLAVNAYGHTSDVVLSDLLYLENECVHQTEASKLSDCAANAVVKIQAFDCFSTSSLPRSGMTDGLDIFPSLVGPSILNVAMTEKLNDAKDGFLLEVSFEGMFTGTTRKYSMTLEDKSSNYVRIEGLSFGRTASESFSRPLLLTSAEETFQFNASFKIVTMEKAATTASNDYDVGEGPEPEWSLWYHATTSKFGNLIPMSFTTPSPPTLTKITAALDTTNLNAVDLTLTIDKVLGGDFKLIVTDTSDSSAAEIDLGTYSFESSVTESSQSKSITIYPTGKLAYGKTYRIKTLESPTLPIVHSSRTFTVPVLPVRVESTSNPQLNDAKTEVTVSLNGMGFTSTITSISVKRSTQTIAAKSVTIKSLTLLELVVPAGRSESSTTVQFGEEYLIESVTTSDSSTVTINGEVKFSVPLAPIVSSPSTRLDTTSNMHFKLSVSCANFQSGTKWNVFLQDRTEPILIDISTSLTGESDRVKAGGNGELKFDSTYVITSITLHGSPAVHALFTDASFTTPKGPTLTSISNASVSPSDSNSVSMTLVGERMPSALFSIQVVEVGQSSVTHTLDGSFSSSTNGRIDVEVRNKNTIEYGKVYQIETVSNFDVIVALPSTLTFEVPVFLTKVSSTINILNNEEVFVSVSGFGFPPSTNFDLTIVQVDTQNTAIGQPFILGSQFPPTPSNADISTHKITTTVEIGKLEPGKKYKLTSFDISSKLTAIEQDLVFDVLSPPTLTSIALIPSGNSKRVFKLEVNGTDLPQGKTFVIKLKEFDSTFEILVESLLSGSSSEIGLGFSDTLQFSTTYHLDKATLKSDPAISPTFSSLYFQTEAQPHPLILFADTTTHSDPFFCGDLSLPCSSMDVAWKIVTAFSATQIQLKIPLTTTLFSPIAISEMMTVSLERGGVQTAIFSIPPTLTENSNGILISIAGTVEIEHVNINVAASPHDFILLDVSSGSLSMTDVKLTRVMAEVLPVESLEELCSWETGLMQLSNSDVTVHTTVFSGFEMGVLWMEGSNLTLSYCTFGQNGQQRTSFPSARQNIRCEGGIVSITQNAESNANTVHQWISSENCEVSLNNQTLSAPLFVPSLDANNSKTTFDKKQSHFTVEIVGSMLVPCGLSLEVFSITPSSSTSNDNPPSVVLPLSFDQTSHWSEDNLSLIIPSSSLALLSPTLQWEARLLFAGNQSTASFLFQLNSKDRIAQSFKNSLPWFIPLVVGVIVLILAIIVIIIVCLRRRKQKSKEAQSRSHLAEELEDEIPVKYDHNNLDNQTTHNVIELKDDEDGRFALAQKNYPSTELPVPEMEESKEDTPMLIPVTALRCEGDFPVVVVDGVNTLYQRIHHGNKIAEMKKKEMGSRIAAGLIRMVEDKVHLGAAARLTPHWVVVDKNDTIHLRIEEPQNTQTQNPSDHQMPHHVHANMTKALADGIEGIRWRAPEEGEKESEVNENVDKVKVSVFRLGLVLWEMETELVPFGEIDAVSAHRQLACGVELQLGKIQDSSVRELISQCLHVEPEQRPTLKDIFATLETSMNTTQKQAANSNLLNSN
ncbi:hypothetical protein BLNAU_21408 [Blattamonas nauphoetae]|uniref:Protein kinase domain-containing protein n=1 Tax=Blattamonas nauphoetae TaxID=2049346 RepID=A0ABQ9X052_9EUKA|nr:hypothetical protein BLNAU_21408 [Blattamonas nauphoetae]